MRLKATGATYINSGQQLACPRCESKQVKSFSLMSRKFPKPEQTISELFNSEKYNKRVFKWENSYQCQKCSNEFVALFEDDYQDILQGKSPEEAKKSFKEKVIYWQGIILYIQYHKMAYYCIHHPLHYCCNL